MLIVDVDVSAPAALLDGMIGRLENQRTLMGVLAHGLEEYEEDVFASRGRGQWAPDDPDTIEAKGSGRVLVDSGDLLRNLTTARIQGDTVSVVQGDAFYGSFLRDGDRGMPRRDPAPAPERRDVERWAEQLLGYIVDGRTR